MLFLEALSPRDGQFKVSSTYHIALMASYASLAQGGPVRNGPVRNALARPPSPAEARHMARGANWLTLGQGPMEMCTAEEAWPSPDNAPPIRPGRRERIHFSAHPDRGERIHSSAHPGRGERLHPSMHWDLDESRDVVSPPLPPPLPPDSPPPHLPPESPPPRLPRESPPPLPASYRRR